MNVKPEWSSVFPAGGRAAGVPPPETPPRRRKNSALLLLLLIFLSSGAGWLCIHNGWIKGSLLKALWSLLGGSSAAHGPDLALEKALRQALGGFTQGMTDRAVDAMLPTAAEQVQPPQDESKPGSGHRWAGDSAPAPGQGLGAPAGLSGLGPQAGTSAQGTPARQAAILAPRIDAPSLSYITDTFEGFIKKMHSKSQSAAPARAGGRGYAAGEASKPEGSGDVPVLNNSDFTEDSALRASPTYNQLKAAQKNVMDAVYMRANEADGQKARSGVWSDGNTILYDKIPIEQSDDSFRTKRIRPLPRTNPDGQ